jgi:hypothetical protein
MRTGLNSLGMIGPEFETARKFLTQNIEGDAAFRIEEDADGGSLLAADELDGHELETRLLRKGLKVVDEMLRMCCSYHIAGKGRTITTFRNAVIDWTKTHICI